MSVKRTACTLTGAEADAAACPSHGRRVSLLPLHPSSLPLEGFAVLNDRPVACQIRGSTDSQGDRWHGEAVADEVSPRSGVSVAFVSAGDSFAPRTRERVSDGSLLSTATKVTKSAGRNCVSALPQRATPVRCHPRFPSRNRRFPDRCRSPDCACTAFRCRCLLLW